MKRRVIASATNILLAFGTLGGATTSPNEAPRPQPMYLQAGEEELQRDAFNRIAEWYVDTGHDNAGDAQLALVQGISVFECQDDRADRTATSANSGLGNYYCGPKNTVVLNVGFLAMQDKLFPQEAVALGHFNHAHELGHAAQNSDGLLNDMSQHTPDKVAAIETQATCYAGQAVADLYPQDVTAITHVLNEMYIGPSHGGSAGQSQAFQHGANGGEC